jgi:hypothetical protein
MPQRFLAFHSDLAATSKNRIVLDLKVKVIKENEKDKLLMKEIVTKFTVGKTQGYDIVACVAVAMQRP